MVLSTLGAALPNPLSPQCVRTFKQLTYHSHKGVGMSMFRTNLSGGLASGSCPPRRAPQCPFGNSFLSLVCRNPSLGLTTKARACKGVGQKRSPGVTFHAPESAKECEGMNPHTPKGTPTLGVGVPVDS